MEVKSSETPSLQLITYQLGELSKAVEKMSISLDHNIGQLDQRVRTLENWRSSYKGATNNNRMVVSGIISWVVASAALATAIAALLRLR